MWTWRYGQRELLRTAEYPVTRVDAAERAGDVDAG